MKFFKSLIANLLLFSVSLIVSIALLEAGLRIFYPKYQDAADVQFQFDSMRISSRPPNTRRVSRHPDTGKEHAVIYNNLGLRQHRDFDATDLKSSINIGFFGDSYTENVGLPGPYSFTEPLDYLLNHHANQDPNQDSGSSAPHFNVLNFGHSGYGTGQAYINYLYPQTSARIDHVFYVACNNDLRNLYEHKLFYLDDNGVLQRNHALEPPWYIRALSRLHSTYLALDVYYRLFPRKNDWEPVTARLLQEKRMDKTVRKRTHSATADGIENAFRAGEETVELTDSVKLFRAILRAWKEETERRGQTFHVVILPHPVDRKLPILIDPDIDVVNLYELFAAAAGTYNYSTWFFKKDGHWNEAGNQMAAIQLYKLLERETGNTAMSDQQIGQQLYRYYKAMPYGWQPSQWVSEIPTSSSELESIRASYLPLEQVGTGDQAPL